MADFKLSLLGMCAFLLVPSGLALAQTATVRTPENVRAEPNGEIVGVLEAGTPLTVVDRRERWLEVELEGWVWTRSLQVVDRGAYDLVISAEEGENLRASPSGAILGRMGRGTLLGEQERVPGWVRARRRGWIWGPSVSEAAAGATAPAPATPRGERASWGVGAFRSRNGAAILDGPDGDTLARARPGAELQLLAREGSWVRVRVEGWTWMPPDAGSESTGEVLRVPPADLAADPGYRGRLISWDLQFLSLERAERIRTDFFEGEPFLLTRHSSGSYVYVAIPPDRVADALTLAPLERITVVGRVRATASALTGSPILDLVEWVRSGERR